MCERQKEKTTDQTPVRQKIHEGESRDCRGLWWCWSHRSSLSSSSAAFFPEARLWCPPAPPFINQCTVIKGI